MASSTRTTAARDEVVKAGYWFCTSELQVSDINSLHFTHLYAGFAKVQYPVPSDEDISNVIKFPDNTGRFESFPATVKRSNPRVKALLSIGGEGSDDISRAIAAVARDAEVGLRQTFIAQSIKLARNHKYDGLDLCWLYPSNANEQTSHLASFLSDWRIAVDAEAAKQTNRPKLILTATVFHHPVIDRDNFKYPVEALIQNLDRINVLAFEFYNPASNSPSITGPVHAWHNFTDENRCGSAGIGKWIENTQNSEVPTHKFVLGLPFYGYEWILKNPNNNGIFVPARAANDNTKPIPYKTIKAITEAGYETRYEKEHVAIYSHNKETGKWIGYDDERSISEKVREAIGNTKLGGYFAWNVGDDDKDWTLSTEAYKAADAVNP